MVPVNCMQAELRELTVRWNWFFRHVFGIAPAADPPQLPISLVTLHVDAAVIKYEHSVPVISQACLARLAHLSLLSPEKREVQFMLLAAVSPAAGPAACAWRSAT
jgi:hypothetical protein